MKKTDWSVIKFISRKDEWYVEGTEAKCQFDYGEPKLSDTVENNCGLFEGLTNEIFPGFTGELPRHDEECCDFAEFDIYLGDVLINDITYENFYALLKQIDRKKKLKEL